MKKILLTLLSLSFLSFGVNAKIISLECTRFDDAPVRTSYITIDTDRNTFALESGSESRTENLSSSSRYYWMKYTKGDAIHKFSIDRRDLSFEYTLDWISMPFVPVRTDGQCDIKQPLNTLI